MRLLPECVLPKLPARLPQPSLPPGISKVQELFAANNPHPERGRWLAEWEWRNAYNQKINEREDRLNRSAADILEFARIYFPNTFNVPFCDFHRDLMDLFFDIPDDEWFVIDTEGVPQPKQGIVAAAPRGSAKSTMLTFLLPIYCAVFRLKKFILILSDSDEQVRTFCAELKAQIEDNELLKADFGEMSGLHYSGMRWTGRDFDICHAEPDDVGNLQVVSRTHIAGRSFHSRLRGLKSGADRPDFVIMDDCENDERVRTLEQRERLEESLNKVVIPMLDPKTKLFVLCGTIMHFDSLLSRLLSPAKAGSYVQRVWRCIKSGRDIFDPQAVPLWPERFDLAHLRRTRAQMSEGEFNTEYMNDPHDPSSRQYLPDWIKWFARREYLRYNNRQRCFEWHRPGHYDVLSGAPIWQKLHIYQAVDPAIGESARSDYFAMITAGLSEQTHDVVLLDLVCERLNFADQVATILHQFDAFPDTIACAVESVGYQQALYQTILRRQAKRFGVRKVPLKSLKVRNGTNQKHVRLQRRAWDVQTGTIWFPETRPGDKGFEDSVSSEETLTGDTRRIWMRFHPLYVQMMEFPKSRNDDALDAFDMLLEVMGKRLLRSPMVDSGEDEDTKAANRYSLLYPAVDSAGGATTNAVTMRRTRTTSKRRG